MIHSRLVCAALLALAGGVLVPTLPVAPAAPVPKHLMPKEEPVCYPTRVGTRLVSKFKNQELTVVVAKVERTEDGFEVTEELEDAAGKRTHDITVVASARGLKVTRYTGKDLDPPLWWLKLPHVANNEWTDTWYGQTRKHRTIGWEDVEVPAGKIRAIRVERDDNSDGTSKTTYWYAPELGCIKWSSGPNGRELTSFTLGK
jgi:hypothetical protein